MPPERTSKQRIRQACEPCRRKKSKCPGEKPECSFCARLGQDCVYRNENRLGNSPATDLAGTPAKLEALEVKLDAVLQAVSSQNVNQQPPSNPEVSVVPTSIRVIEEWEKLATSLPPWESMQEAGALYLLYCECQPLPLFHRDTFLASLRGREPEVLFSILASTARFSNLGHASTSKITNAYMEEARRLVNRNIFEGSVRLSTLQSLCLLSVIDFTSGNTHRASLTNCMAMDLAHSAGLTSENHTINATDTAGEERRRCFWSIILCRRLHGTNFSSLDLSTETDVSWYPKSCEQPPLPSTINARLDVPLSDASQSPNDSGILAYMIQLSEIWFKITQYARRRGTPSFIPPWSSQSHYSTITSQHMEFDAKMPHKHRFKLSEFHNRNSQELNSNRTYWGPWLFIQFLYHTNICLLNHPLILSLRLRNFRNSIPDMFLHQTSDLISTHATWVVRFIDMVEGKQYKVSDPFLGHCVAIIATIHLQHAFTIVDPSKRKEKKCNFAKCLNFVRVMGQQWAHMAIIAEKLQTLETIVSKTNQARGQSPQVPTRGMLIDLGRFWEILDYCASSAKPHIQQNLIAPELYTSLDGQKNEVSLTSVLPEPIRLDDYIGRKLNASTSEPAAEVLGTEHYRQTPQVFPGATSTENNWDMGVAFSEDELAVLADNFFETANPVGGVDIETEWWSLGNR